MTRYGELMRATGRNFSIENHKKPEGPTGCHLGGASSCPTLDYCPFNWYRSSHDISSKASSWFGNLQTVIPFVGDPPLSRPGCWAYPDMLEVGRVEAPNDNQSYWLSWNRAHFGAWCAVSSPLILGLELSDANLDPILDIIGNTEAIDVNQAWAGHPGRLVAELPVAPSSSNWAVRRSGQGQAPPPPPMNQRQLWAKPLEGGGVAALVINASPHSIEAGAERLSFAALNLTDEGGVAASSAMVRDIWCGERSVSRHFPHEKR
jgi:alpha-galactosidase